ncbi:MAG TPA: hypothetical protein VN688_09535 [Gemmataceae bacterium]|nr:hypothetical protein [Gemmataceae bacterium]
MHILRSFAFTLVIVFLPAAFTACGKVHPASQRERSKIIAPEAKPVVLAADKPSAPPERVKADNQDLNQLNLEVTALETLNQFKLTRPQLQHLAKLAPMTAPKAAASRPTKVSAEYQKALKDLREALLEDNEVRTADLTLALEELRDKENPEFEDVEITDEARRHTAEFLRSLSARQIMGYLTDFADEFPDPREKMTDAFDAIRKLPAPEQEELRDEVAGQVGWLVAGLDTAAERKVHDRVTALINRVRRLKDDEYTAQQAELDRAVQGIMGNVGPVEVVRHFTERSLAELLSNPRLSAAVAARLKKTAE